MRQIKERSKKTLEQQPANFTGTGKPFLPEQRAAEKARRRRTRRPKRRQLPRPLSQAPRGPNRAKQSPKEKTRPIKSRPRERCTRSVSQRRSRPRRLRKRDRKSTRLNSSHGYISYAVFCLKKKN